MRGIVIVMAGLLGLSACSDMRGIIPGLAESDAPLDATGQTAAVEAAPSGVVAEAVTVRSGGLGPLPGGQASSDASPRPATQTAPSSQPERPVVAPVLVAGCDAGLLVGGAGYCVGQ